MYLYSLIGRRLLANNNLKYLLIPVILWGASALQATDYSLDLNGNSQYVDCGAGNLSITGASPRTMEAWIKCNSFNDVGALQMGQHGIHHGEFTLRTGYTDNHWIVQIWNDDFDFVANSKNIWTHIAITYDGTTIKAYVNGEFVTSYVRDLNTVAANFYIGRWDNGFFDGQIDEVLVYNDVRSQTEIQRDMYDVDTHDSNLQAYYKMSNGSGTTLDNNAYYHAHNNIGTLSGGITWVTGVYETSPLGSGVTGDPYQISTLRDLFWLTQNSTDWDKDYLQTANIDAVATSGWSGLSSGGYASIGNYNTNFTGSYDGDGHTIDNFYIKRTYIYDVYCEYVGLFARTYTASISDLGLTNVYVEGYRYVGGLAGMAHTSTISNCYTTGSVKSSGYNAYQCGGLVGQAISTSIISSNSSASIIGNGSHIGGLVGYMSATTLTQSYSTGNVSSSFYDDNTGGLVGKSEGSSTVSKCYSLGNVSASSNASAGGLIGWNLAAVTNCFSRGSVSSSHAGGLVGNNYGTISRSYATGIVSDQYYNGGLVSGNSGTVTNSFWDTETSEQSSGNGGTGKTTAQMNVRTTFSDATWDFKGETTNGTDEIWNISHARNDGYPYFDWQYPTDPVIDPATVSTTAISNITTTTASSGGSISSDGNGDIAAKGVCWSTVQSPTINALKTGDGTGTDSYSSTLSGLSNATTYYVRAYATNPAGTAYGDQKTFTTWDALPDFSASPTSHDFGTLLIGETAQQTITVTNTGGGFLNISTITPPAAAYTVSPASASIAGGGSQDFTVTFTPVTASAQNGNLAFTDNAGNHTVALSGSAVFQAQTDAESGISFDGTNDYIQTDLDAQPTALSSTTWEAWIKPGRLNYASFQGIITTDDGGWDRGIWIVPNSSSLVIGYGTNGWNTGISLTVDTWYHIAIVYKPDNVLFYLNGVEHSLGQAPAGQNTVYDLRIGADYANRGFLGEIDEVRIWNDVRSQAEIQENYGSLAGDEAGLVAYWRLDENTGSVAGDGTGNSYSGTLMNSPTWVASSGARVSDPVFAVNPTSHAFGNVLIGENESQSFTISNNGGGFINIASTTTPGGQYSISPTNAAISAAGSQVFTLDFEPTSSGEDNGNLTFTDNLNNHTVTITGAGIFQAQADAGNALTFNGTNQYLETDVVSTATDNVSMEAWVNWDGQSSGSAGILYNGNSGANGYGLMLYDGAGRNLTILCGGIAFITSSTPLPAGAWHHVAAVRESGTWKLYLDGIERTINAAATVPNVPVGKLNIASNSSGTGLFPGKIDEVRFWNVARSQTEIRESYASLAGNKTGLIAYYRLDEGSGTSAGDGTGHGYTATLYNSPTRGNSSAPVSNPVFAASPSSHAFGNVLIGEGHQQSITVTNTGGGILHISSLATPGADFTVSPSNTNIASGDHQVFSVTFSPTSTNTQSGNLAFTSNLGTSNVVLSGTGMFAAQTDAEKSLSFTGSNSQYLIISDPVNPTAYTVEMWVKPSGGVNQNLFVRTSSAQPLASFSQQLYINSDGYFTHYLWDGSGRAVTGTTIAQENTWYHIAITAINNGTMRLYVNGREEGTAVTLGTMQSSQDEYRIASPSHNGSLTYFTGEIDEIRLWDDVRTQTEIRANYGSLAGNETGLTGYWRLDEGSGSTSGDGTGQGHAATLYNSPGWGSSSAPVRDPVYASSASSLDLGSVVVGSSSQQTVTISNTGGGVLNIASAASDEGQFIVNPASAVILSGSSQLFTITFTPTSQGSKSGTLTLTHNPNGSSHVVSLTGVGQQALFSSSSGSVDFGTVQVDAGSSEPITISNNGNISLGISGIVCSNNDYSISPTSATIAAGGTREFIITLTASSTGSSTGTITFSDNAPNSPQQISVSGNAVILFGSGTEQDPYQMNSLNDLKIFSENSSFWGSNIIQTAHINASATSTWNSGAGFLSIGSSSSFSGTYNGNGYTIDSLVINRASTNYQGFFSILSGATIKNLGMTHVTISGKEHVGALAGYCENSSSIENCYSTGVINGSYHSVGGLVGDNMLSSIVKQSYSSCSVTSTGTGLWSTGGLIGYNNLASVQNCYASGNVTGINAVGGLVGNNTSGTISNSYSYGTVTGTGSNIGGFVGVYGSANNCFWDTETSGQSGSALGTGKNTTEMQLRATFTIAGWDFKGESTNGTANIWNMGNGRNSGYPYLDWEHPNDVVIQPASIVTHSVNSITSSSSASGGEISSGDNGDAVTVRGVCWSLSENPTTGSSKTTDGSGAGSFSSALSGLSENTDYHVRAYASNLAGTAYGADISFTTLGMATVTTQTVSNIASSTATGNGTVTDLGNPGPDQHGVCWATSENPTLNDNKVELGSVSSTGSYTADITGLNSNTLYHVRAYVSNSVGTSYGADVSFTTFQAPTVTTQAVSSIDQTSATGNGNITVLGNPTPTQHGVCWGASENPTTENSKTEEGSVAATGAFSSAITGLNPGTSYHVRAYAVNSTGIVYGDDVTFSTYLPATVTTLEASSVGMTTATGNGNITVLGIPAPTQHGVCWGLSENPTTANSKTEAGAASATGAFTGAMSGLSSNTTYHVRAYAVNTAGTSYGVDVSFITTATEPDAQAEQLVFSDPGRGQVTLSWTNGNGARRIIFLKEASTGEAVPEDRTSYTASTTFESGSQIGSTGWYCVYAGTGTTVSITNLTQSTTYRAMVFEYNGASGSENYLSNTATDNPANYFLPWFIEAPGISLTDKRYSAGCWGDIDNDNDLDLITTGSPYGSLTELYRNDGSNTFTTLSGHGIPNLYNVSLDWKDFDNDGYVDLLVSNYTNISIYRNNHDYTFTQSVNINAGTGGKIQATWTDYNKDGALDVLITSTTGTAATKLYKNDGAGNLVEDETISFSPFAYSRAAWGDYNNDGYPDVFLTGYSGSQPVSMLYKNIAGTSFEAQSGLPWTPVYYPGLAWADYNNDGWLDLAVAGVTISSSLSKIYKNNGNNTFTPLNATFQNYYREPNLSWGDYDSDGDPDLLISNSSGGLMISRLYQNNGNDSFVEQTDISLDGAYRGTSSWGDYDSDGDLDLLVCGEAGYYNGDYHGRVELYKNIGGSPNTPPVAPANLQVTINEFVTLDWDKATDAQTSQNGLGYNLFIGTSESTGNILSPLSNFTTGKRRIVAPGNTEMNTSYAAHNLPGGTYYWGVQTIDNSYSGSSFTVGSSFSVAYQASSLVFSNKQVNSLDLSWTNGEMANRVVFMKQTSSGNPVVVDNTSYSANPVFGSGSQIGSSGWYCVYNGSGSSVSVSNLTAIATYRVMVCEYSGAAGSEDYLLLTTASNPSNQTMPYFIEQTSVSLAGVSYSSVAWGDYNNDGYEDILLVGQSGSSYSKIYKNNGDNSFSEQTSISLPGVGSGTVAWCDYNNDGYLDFLLSGQVSWGNNIAKIYKNNGGNGFTEQTGIGLTGFYDGAAAWGDYNNDGYSDLIIAGTDNSLASITKVYRNNGDNTFSEQTDISLPGASYSCLDWGDYDGDGDLDLVLFGFNRNTYVYTRYIYRNNGNNTFTVQSGINLSTTTHGSTAWGDYDNDGDLDLLSSGSNHTIIYRNNGNNTFTSQPELGLVDVSYSSAAWGDFDNDGDLDILLSGDIGSNTYISRVYQNNGDNTYSKVGGIDLDGVYQGDLAWCDYDHDNDLDILLTGYNGSSYVSRLYRNASPTANTAPAAPSNLQVNSATSVSFSWDKATDSETAQNALSYNLFIGNSVTSGEALSPMADISSGQRRITAMGNTQLDNTRTLSGLPTGTYYWGVQAIDNGFMGSSFASGGSFFFLSSPTSAATNLQFTDVQAQQLTLNWTSGNGDKRVVFVLQGASGSPAPVNDIAYTASSTFRSGSQIGSSGWYCVYNGTGSSVTISNIGEHSSYRFAVVEYKQVDNAYRYLTTGGVLNPRSRYQSISGSGLAVSFDGSNDHVVIPTALAGSLSEGSAITIEYWFKGSQLQSPVRIQSANGYIVAGWRADNPVHIISTDGGTTSGLSVGVESVVEDGTWHHLAMTWEKNTPAGFCSYLDGVLVASRTSADVDLPAFSNTISYLGCYNGSSEFINGQMDEIRIWNVARTQLELSANMCLKLNPDSEPNLVAYYNCDGIAGSSQLTEPKNAYTGTLSNCDTNAVWVPSAVPMGDSGNLLWTTTPTQVGAAGQSCLVTITGNPDISNFISLYTVPGSGGSITVPDVGTWPAEVVRRADIIWGVHAVGTVAANLVFDYSQIGVLPEPVRLIKRANPGAAWIDVTGDFIHDAVNKTFTRLNNTSFSEYSAGSLEGDGSLPVTISEFKANIHDQKVELVWTTDSEIENLGFILERKLESVIPGSVEGEKTGDDRWIQIASYETASELEGRGSVNIRSQYSYTDNSVVPGNAYNYRLADVSYDGDIVYHTMTLVGVKIDALPEKFTLYQNYPNPFNPSTAIRYELPTTSDVEISIYNLLGQQVYAYTEQSKSAGYYTHRWNGLDKKGSQVASGVYFILVSTPDFRAVKKMILNR